MPETIDDKIQATMKKEKDEFDDAFDKIVDGDTEFKEKLEGDDKVLDKTDTKGQAFTSQDTDTAQSTDGTNTDQSTQKPDESQDGSDKEDPDAQMDNTNSTVNTDLFPGLKGNEAAESANQNVSATDDDTELVKLQKENSDLQAALKSEQQKTSSWNGRITKANERAKDAEKTNADLLKRIEALESGTAKAPDAAGDNGEKDSAVVEKFFGDFPEFKEPLKILIKKAGGGLTMEEVMDAVKPEVQKVEKQVTEKSSQDKFMDALRIHHKDVDTILDSGKVLTWIKQQPHYMANELLRIYQEGGTLDESVNLLNEFKRTSGYKTDNQSNPDTDPKKDKLESMMEVDSDSAGPPAGEADKNDFDAAAKEAFKD